MSANPKSKRPGPNSYDHLWSLLPVFTAFFAVIVFLAATDDRPAQGGFGTEFVPLQALEAEPSRGYGADTSVPSAAEAVARVPELAAEPAPTF